MNGLFLTVNAAYEDRRVLENTTSFSFINTHREYTPNVPVNMYLDSTANPINAMRDQRHVEISATASYTPMQRYSIFNGSKIYRGSDWPTFGLTWEHGINEFEELADRYRHYDMIRLDISRNNDLGAFSEFNWRIRTGGFLNNKFVPYYDFFHFNTQPVYVLIDDYNDSFKLPAYYSLSTPEFFGEVHLKYTTPYLLAEISSGIEQNPIERKPEYLLSRIAISQKLHRAGIQYYRAGISGRAGSICRFRRSEIQKCGCQAGAQD